MLILNPFYAAKICNLSRTCPQYFLKLKNKTTRIKYATKKLLKEKLSCVCNLSKKKITYVMLGILGV